MLNTRKSTNEEKGFHNVPRANDVRKEL